MIFKKNKKLNKKNSKFFLNKLINKENIKFYRVDFEKVDFDSIPSIQCCFEKVFF